MTEPKREQTDRGPIDWYGPRTTNPRRGTVYTETSGYLRHSDTDTLASVSITVTTRSIEGWTDEQVLLLRDAMRAAMELVEEERP